VVRQAGRQAGTQRVVVRQAGMLTGRQCVMFRQAGESMTLVQPVRAR